MITCALLFISESRGTVAIDQDGKGFLNDIFRFYGENGSISTENLQNLLLLISARRPEFIVNDENPLVDATVC